MRRTKQDAEELARLAAIVESSDDAIFSKTLDGTVTSWNPGAERLYGYTAEEMIGKNISLIVPAERTDELTDIMERLRHGERVAPYETVRVCKDGRQVVVSVSISPIKDSSGRVLGASTIARDRTTHKRTDAALLQLQATAEHHAVVQETASHIALDILASRTGVEALRHIAEAARRLSGARYAALGVARPDGQGLQEFATVGLSLEEEKAIGPRPRGIGILSLLLQRTEPLRINDLADHPASAGFPPNHPPMHSFLGVPIRRGNTVLGSLYLTDKLDGGVFTEEDAVAVQALGAYAVVAIHNLHMLSRQRALVSGLIAAQEEERRAVAYDLHDGLTQYVMAAHAHLETFRRAHEQGNQARAAREMEQGLKYLKEAVVESRRLINGLRSLALEELGLAGALEQLLAEEKLRADWQEADLIHNVAGRRFDKTLETAVYRVAQEALTNAHKHAATSRVRMLLLLETAMPANGALLRLEVRDWGNGFVPEQKIGMEGHVGLQGMVERVNLMGGTYELHSAPGVGTTIHAVFPVLEPRPENEEGEAQ